MTVIGYERFGESKLGQYRKHFCESVRFLSVTRLRLVAAQNAKLLI